MTFRTSWGISFHEYLVPLFSVRVSLRSRRTASVETRGTASGRPRPHPRKVQPYPVETQVDPGRIRVGDPERPSSGRPRPHPRKVQPHPVETQVDPGRIRVGDPDRPASGRTDLAVSGRNSSEFGSHQGSRPRPASIRANPTGPHPDKPTWPDSDKPTWPYPVEIQVDPGRIRVGDPERPSSGRPRTTLIRANPNGPHPGDPDLAVSGEIQANSGQTQANPADKGKHKQLQHIHANTSEPSKHKQTQATPAYSRKQRQTHANSSIFKHEKGKETFDVHIRLSAGGASGAQPYVGAALQGCAGGVDSAHAQAQHRICR